jgi:Anti-sigma-K factor rskA/Sigma-70, region 4
MATFDQLSAEQRAIVELVLQQGKTYPELAEMLGMPESRVRELARDALVELAPVSVRGVEADWRGQLADYVLGQQAGPEATATKGHLRRSEAARSWARSLLDSLEQLYANGSVPAIPEGERGRAKRPPVEPSAAPAGAAGLSAAPSGARGLASDPIMRRRLLAAAAAAVVILLAVLVWPIGLLTGDDDKSSSANSDNQSSAQGNQNQATATNGPAGIAIVVDQGGKKQLLVQAARLAPSGQNEGYYVWLYNSPSDARSLGGQVTDQQGNYQAIGPFPADYAKYKFIDVTRQPVGKNPNVKHSGQSVLRGPMPKLRNAQGTAKKPAALGQTVLRPPS